MRFRQSRSVAAMPRGCSPGQKCPTKCGRSHLEAEILLDAESQPREQKNRSCFLLRTWSCTTESRVRRAHFLSFREGSSTLRKPRPQDGQDRVRSRNIVASTSPQPPDGKSALPPLVISRGGRAI